MAKPGAGKRAMQREFNKRNKAANKTLDKIFNIFFPKPKKRRKKKWWKI